MEFRVYSLKYMLNYILSTTFHGTKRKLPCTMVKEVFEMIFIPPEFLIPKSFELDKT